MSCSQGSRLAAADLPAAWNQRYVDYLGYTPKHDLEAPRARPRAPRVGRRRWQRGLGLRPATAGRAVSVVDPSPNALAALRRRARDAGLEALVTAVPGEVERLSEVAPLGRADLALGHGLLEVVDDVAAAVRALARAAAPGGAVSVLVAGRFAAVLARTLAGRLTEARARSLPIPPGGSAPTTRSAAASTSQACVFWPAARPARARRGGRGWGAALRRRRRSAAPERAQAAARAPD